MRGAAEPSPFSIPPPPYDRLLTTVFRNQSRENQFANTDSLHFPTPVSDRFSSHSAILNFPTVESFALYCFRSWLPFGWNPTNLVSSLERSTNLLELVIYKCPLFYLHFV